MKTVSMHWFGHWARAEKESTMSKDSKPIPTEPQGDLVIRTIALPKDTNSNGDIFGGWLVSQMDLGGGIAAKELTGGRVTTVAIDFMRFWNPVRVGDTVCCYAKLVKKGTTSLTLEIAAWSAPIRPEKRRCVTHALFTYVSIDQKGCPKPIQWQT
jgi:acyl-CoA thioesterase YciA